MDVPPDMEPPAKEMPAGETPGTGLTDALGAEPLAGEKLRLAVEAAGLGLWEYEIPSGRLAWSDRLKSFYGLPADAEVDFDRFMAGVHPDDRSLLMEGYSRALEGQEKGRFGCEHRTVAPDGTVRWLQAAAQVLFDADGRPVRVIGTSRDVTEARVRAAALAESEDRLRLAQDAGRIGNWDWDLETGAVRWSDSLYRLMGMDPATPVDADTFIAMLHEEDRTAAMEAVRASVERRVPFDIEFRVLPPGGGVRWLASRGTGVAGPDGVVRRVAGINFDITEKRMAADRQRLLMAELDHRAKNLLAVMQAVLRLTPAEEVGAYRRTLEGRISALARAHTILAGTGWSGAPLHELAAAELAPFGIRATAEGPGVMLAAAAVQPAALMLHELSTNAVKHGALSTGNGRVALTWTLEEGALALSWSEEGGPPVEPPRRKGFGSTVLEQSVRYQLSGTVEADWRETGLRLRVLIPAEHLAG